MGKDGRTAGPAKRKTITYWRAFEAGLEGHSLLGATGGPPTPEAAEDTRLGYAAGSKIRGELRAARQRPSSAPSGTLPPRSAVWRAGYGAGVRGEEIGDLLWQQDDPASKAELQDGYLVGRRKFLRQKD